MYQQTQQNEFDLRTGINVFYLLVNGYATCFTVFLRRGFGAEAFGFNALIAVVIMIVYMQAHPQSGAMIDFFGLWWVALILQRIGFFIRRRRGFVIHSRFEGVPWIAQMIPALDRIGLARVTEFLLCFFSGAVLGTHDEALGQFVMFGAFGLLTKNILDNMMARKHIQRMQDAALEQRARLERWRHGNF